MDASISTIDGLVFGMNQSMTQIARETNSAKHSECTTDGREVLLKLRPHIPRKSILSDASISASLVERLRYVKR